MGVDNEIRIYHDTTVHEFVKMLNEKLKSYHIMVVDSSPDDVDYCTFALTNRTDCGTAISGEKVR